LKNLAAHSHLSIRTEVIEIANIAVYCQRLPKLCLFPEPFDLGDLWQSMTILAISLGIAKSAITAKDCKSLFPGPFNFGDLWQ